MDSHVSLLVAISGLLVGGGGVWTFFLVAYRSGKFTEKLERIEKAVNGPLQTQFDQMKEDSRETRRMAKDAFEAMTKRASMCEKHEANLNATIGAVKRIENRLDQVSSG